MCLPLQGLPRFKRALDLLFNCPSRTLTHYLIVLQGYQLIIQLSFKDINALFNRPSGASTHYLIVLQGHQHII